jgi:tetratricopeptide (TPR) repeat protein
MEAEEVVGSVGQDIEEYPTALTHFAGAHKASQDLHQNEPYEALHCADTLWRLGRYSDAEEMLASVPAEARSRVDIGSGIADTQAQMQLSQGQFRKALTTARNAIRTFPSLPSSLLADFERIEAMAEAQLGDLEAARRDADTLLALAQKEKDEGMTAGAELLDAEILLRSHQPEKALAMAEAANRYAAGKGQKESEWRSLLYLASAAKDSGDKEGSVKRAEQALEILNRLQQSWGDSTYQQYTSRPDHQLALRQLSGLKDSSQAKVLPVKFDH